MSKEELLKLDYPNKKSRKSYMAFSITPLEMDLTFLAEHHLIERCDMARSRLSGFCKTD